VPSPSESSPAEPSRVEQHEGSSERKGGLVRRVLSHRPTPEERLEQLLAERRRELAEQAAIVEQTLADLEEREQRLRDSRASIERLLRLGQRDLDLRESDLVRLGRELEERGSRVEDEEAELTRRRAELGAVELKRAALEQRDRALAAREADLDDRAARLDEHVTTEVPRASSEHAEGIGPASEAAQPGAMTALLFVPGTAYRLVETSEPVAPGATVELDGEEYVVARIGPSPLPGDARRCSYLVRGGPTRPASLGSS
jgi:hypothetical protein